MFKVNKHTPVNILTIYSIYIYIHLHVLPEELVTDLLAGDEVHPKMDISLERQAFL